LQLLIHFKGLITYIAYLQKSEIESGLNFKWPGTLMIGEKVF